MKHATHPTFEKLQAFSLGQLEGDEATRIERHVASCTDCCQHLEAVPADGFVQLLRAHRPGAAIPSAAPVPQKLARHPRYRLLAVIGQGGLGTVYRARDRVLKKDVALKVIDAKRQPTPKLVERLSS